MVLSGALTWNVLCFTDSIKIISPDKSSPEDLLGKLAVVYPVRLEGGGGGQKNVFL